MLGDFHFLFLLLGKLLFFCNFCFNILLSTFTFTILCFHLVSSLHTVEIIIILNIFHILVALVTSDISFKCLHVFFQLIIQEFKAILVGNRNTTASRLFAI